MCMDGDWVRCTPPLVVSSTACGRERISFSLVAMTRRSIRRPIAWRSWRRRYRRKSGGRVQTFSAAGRAERHGAGEIIARLGEHARPIDRVDAAKAEFFAEAAVANSALTMACASSNVPSMAMAWTLSSPPSSSGGAGPRRRGLRIEDENATSRRGKAAIAAAPVSPEVAPMIVARWPRARRA